MSDDYGYINARVRAMKSFLLKKEDYLEAARQNTPEEFIGFLSRQPSYSDDVHQALSARPLRLAGEEALRLNLCRIFRKLLKFSEGRPKELMLILLRPWDVYNLKTIIRGILTQQEKEEIIQALIPAGSWGLGFLSQLAGLKDLSQLASSLFTSDDALEKEFALLIKNYAKEQPLEILEDSLEQSYFQKGQAYLRQDDTNEQLVSNYLSLQIDFLNILLAFRKITQVTDLSMRLKTTFIEKGRLPEAFLKDLLSLKSVEEALGALQHSPYAWLARQGLILYKEDKRLSSLERLLKNKVFSFSSHLYTSGNPLSIGIPLAFINFKDNEIRNLRLLYQAVNFAIPYALIKEEIICA